MSYTDVLNAKGTGVNQLNSKEYSDNYKIYAKFWSKLPMYTDTKKVKNFFDLLNNKQVILLISGTGSGKTVLVPKYVLKWIIDNKLPGKVGVTNPKSLTTFTNAEYGAKTLDVNLGEEVGYKFRGAPKDSMSDKTKLLYATDGIILANILNSDPLLKNYNAIIIDEAHERGIQIDVLLNLLREIVKKREDFKLIIMSATINAEVFKNYFDIEDIKFGQIEISGAPNYPIKQHFLQKNGMVSRRNYVQKAVDQVIEIIDKTKEGDIIVFVATENDTHNGCELLREKCPQKTEKIKCKDSICVEVYSKMKPENKELAISKNLYKEKGYKRKVIFATNVAESSITFDGIVYVIESGFELSNYFDAEYNNTVVTKTYTSQAQIKQRIGRAGRTQPGESYHLYSEKEFNEFKKYPSPNISVVDLTDYILNFIKAKKTIHNMITFIKEFITPPNVIQIVAALQKLHYCQAIKIIDVNTNNKLNYNEVDYQQMKSLDDILKINGALTGIGHLLLRFKSTSILDALTMIFSSVYQCSNEIAIMISLNELSSGNIDKLLEYDDNQKELVKTHFKNNINKSSDHLTLYNIYNNKWLNKDNKFLRNKLWEKVENRIKELNEIVKKIKPERLEHIIEKYNLTQIEDFDNKIIQCLKKGYSYNTILHENGKQFKSKFFINNSSAKLGESALNSWDKIKNHHGIATNLVNAFGKSSFYGITLFD